MILAGGGLKKIAAAVLVAAFCIIAAPRYRARLAAVAARATGASQVQAPQNPTALFGALAGFGGVLLMLSILPEKITDFIKSALGLEKRDTLKALFGWANYEGIVNGATTDPAVERAYRLLYALAAENQSLLLDSPGDPDLLGKLVVPSVNGASPADEIARMRKDLSVLDLRMTDLEETRVTRLRLCSMFFGLVGAALLGINAFSLLGYNDLGAAGVALTGLGAGMGAPFWQDFLDSLTKAKQGLPSAK